MFLYTSSHSRHVPLHFIPGQTCSFTLHPLADMFLYTSSPGRHVPLHFIPLQTCSSTLHPLADMFLYTSSLADMFLYTSSPGRHIHSNTNSTSLECIPLYCNYFVKGICSHNVSYDKVHFNTAEGTGAAGTNEIDQASNWQ